MVAQILDISPAEYHARKAVSNTGIGKLLERLAKFKAWFDGQTDEQTEAMLIGSVFHCLGLEPDEFGSRYHVMENSGNSAAARKERTDALGEGLQVLTRSQHEAAAVLIPGLRGHKTIALFLDHPTARKEASIFWEEEIDGITVPCKARLDLFVTPGQHSLILDLKSVNSAALTNPSKMLLDRGYHRQGWWYMRALFQAGLNPSGFYLGAVEKSPPYEAALIEVEAAAIEQGGRECLKALTDYAACTRAGHWPGYSDEVIKADLPDWFYRKEMRNETHGQFTD